MAEIYRLSEQDELAGQEAYIHYLGGVAILNSPSNPVATGLIGENPSESTHEADKIIVAHAESIIWEGLREIVIAANPPEIKQPIVAAEENYEEALPNILRIVESSYKNHHGRIASMNQAFTFVRPMPLRSKVSYGHVCHSRRGKLFTVSLLDDFMPAARFADILTGRRVDGSYPKVD